MHRTTFPFLLSLLAVVAVPAHAQSDLSGRPFNEVTRGSTIGTGLFTIYYKQNDVFLSISPAQFDRDYLLVAQLSQGIGDLGLDGGSTLRSDLVRFHREGDRVELWVVNSHLAATPGTPMARTVGYSFGHSVGQSFEIASERKEGDVLIDITPFFLSDWGDVGTVLQTAAAQRKVTASITLDKDRSSFQQLRLYPTNVEADVRLTFGTPRNLGLETVSDYRSIPIGVHYSLLALPATPMRQRYADDRVGYFVSAMKDFSRDTADNFFVRYINRWRLEKKYPSAASSVPVQPITYYIDRTVPVEWRPYVRAGILEWNRAFEEAGIRDAIRVLDAPDDSSWSAEDARYSTVRWTATNRSVYAVGATSVDPRTGEILNADVLISAGWIQRWRGQSGQFTTPIASVESAFQDDSVATSVEGDLSLCRYGEGLARDGGVATALMAARGDIGAGEAPNRAYIGQALKALVMHEIGHTLGLRHNFRGSAGASAAQLANKGWTSTHGFGVSVMDYMPPSLALDPARQGDYYSPTIGSYDRWAISYGYAAIGGAFVEPAMSRGGGDGLPNWTPDMELNGLKTIAAEAADPEHLYGSDEDAGFGAAGLDPTISRYDQTSDPLAWARDRVTLVDGLFDSLETRVVAPGQSYARLRSVFTDLLADRWYALLVTTKYLGGATISRDHRGDPGERPALVNVPAARQREALGFIADAGFGEKAYRFQPSLLSRLGPDRWSHWGASPYGTRADFPVHDWALNQQGALLTQLLDPVVLARIRDAELRTSDGEPKMGLPELFSTLNGAIWSEVSATTPGRPARGRNISSTRRDLQRLHLNTMTRLALSPAPGTPEDARALARMTLTSLATELDRVLGAPRPDLDPYTRAHLVDTRQRIRQTLDAPLIQATTPR
ncbi:MAG TPA: zinc-dependent metalloprotease [Gemmatimonadales bacterium]